MRKYAGIILYIVFLHFTYSQSILNINKKNYENKYKLVEQLLKKRQGELEDLYKQGDFIVKPEYLEWQVFFSGLYYDAKGGKSSGREFHEIPVVPVPVNFGMLIPMKEIKPEIQAIIPNSYNYNFTDPESIEIGSLELLTVRAVDIPNFDVEIPNIQYPVTFGTIDPITVNVDTNPNGYTSAANNSNMNTNTQNPASTLLANGSSYNGLIQIIGVEGTNYADPLTGTGSVTYVISSDLESQRTKGRIITIESHRGNSEATGTVSAAGDPDEALFVTTTGNLYVNANTTIGVELERGYSNIRNDVIYINKGLIESGAGVSNVIGIDFQGETLGFEKGPIIAENRGTIRMNGNGSIGINSVRTPNATGTDLDIGIKNTGLIEINGDNSYGIFIGGKDLRGKCNRYNGCPDRPTNIASDVMYENLLVQGGTIDINGKNGVGLVLKDTDSVYNVKILNDAVLNETAGIININNENSVGIYTDGSYDNSNIFHGEETNYYNNGTINLNSLDGIGIRVDYSGVENAGTIKLLAGAVNSIGMAGTDQTTTPKNSGLIQLLYGGNENIGIFVNGGNAINLENGVIRVESQDSSGILAYNGTGENKGNIYVDNYDSAGIIADNSTINMNGGVIENTGNNMAIFGTDNSVINLNAGVINTLDEGVSLYLNNGTVANLKNGFTINVYNDSFMLYNKDSSGTYSSVLNTDGVSTANIKESGFAFYYDKNAGTDVEDFLRNTVSGTGTLNLNMEKGSVLIFLDETTGASQYLSSLDIDLSNIGSALKVNGSDYYNYGFNKIGLIIDKNVNLDNPDDTYLKSIYSSSAIEIDPGINITGSEDGQIFIMQENYDGSSGRNEVIIDNNGTIELSGNSSIGILTDFGVINNNAGGEISILGNSSKALVSLNGTAVFNNGIINIGGADSAGIYGSNNFTGVSAVYGDEKIEIHNNGTIQSMNDKKNVYGIYSINERVSSSDARVNLTGSSKILLKDSENSVGVFLIKSTLNGSGIIEIGNKGIGIYGRDSVINLSGFTMNLSGNNALGFYLQGNTSFNAVGGLNTINVNGTDNILYYFAGDFTGSFNQDFTVNAAPGSTYLLGVIRDMSYVYEGTANLGEGGVFVYGTASSVTLGPYGHLNSQYDNIIGLYMDGVYTSSPYDALNLGRINFEGNNSAGIYAEDGARVFNSQYGVISVGTGSAAIYGESAGSILNSGEIYIKDNSTGIYTIDSNSAENDKLIMGNGSGQTGIYSRNIVSALNSATGQIVLTGDGNVGMYSVSSVNTRNDNIISLINISNAVKPGIGIYADGIVTNSGSVSVYDGSAGIYAFNGNLVQDGTVSTGNKGIGIYADNESVVLNGLSSVNTGNNAIGIYGKNNTAIIANGTLNIGTDSFGYVLESGSKLDNSSSISLSSRNVFVYSDGAAEVINNAGADILISGQDNTAFYMVNGGKLINNADITGVAGTSNVGIYNNGGSIENNGDIKTGNSVLVYQKDGQTDYNNSRYSIGVYSENNTHFLNTGNIETGENGVGIYVKKYKGTIPAKNTGNITSAGNGAIGIFAESSVVSNSGIITMNGNNAVGMYANVNAVVINDGVININGDNSVAMTVSTASTAVNNGVINLNGKSGIGGLYYGNSVFENNGIINVNNTGLGEDEKNKISKANDTPLAVPSIVNSGVINVNENFLNEGMKIKIRINPETIRAAVLPEDNGAKFVADSVKFNAPYFDGDEDNPVLITPDFAVGTNALVYKLKDVFNPSTKNGGPNYGIVPIASESLTWKATPVINDSGNLDIWMEKIAYTQFTSNRWYASLGENLDKKYEFSTGDALKIFDSLDVIKSENDFIKIMEDLSGSIYANMNKREQNTADVFQDSLELLQNSENNTKENIKVNVITGKSKNTERQEGVTGYDSTVFGGIILREVERTYYNTVGYSAGYLHTDTDYDDSNGSSEDSDTLQAGVHSRYDISKWTFENDLTGRISFHNVKRNISWEDRKSEMNGDYQSYSFSSVNRAGYKVNSAVMPYAGFRVMYVTRPTFEETGIERLQIEGNNAWSVKPGIGIELKSETKPWKNGWKLKGMLDVAYEYELADLNTEEKARLTVIEDDYHNLVKPDKEKGILKSKITVGAEAGGRFGVFLTGAYEAGSGSNENYRIGINLKAAF
ncbi:autotransporter domain-containing protein [Sebaldella sp. S0638]|uniref:autotransporter domain-containing protein n=1 Tax=Sebaldella sp. S0638 TaxID=2957809 RepID=UPI00209E1320|nr:autotransporter domain-containing protein [Sebaldella sp. S0638]MCP1223913.1 autotransporter domain-containing protein [Sebaldella sp. S0638]